MQGMTVSVRTNLGGWTAVEQHQTGFENGPEFRPISECAAHFEPIADDDDRGIFENIG